MRKAGEIWVPEKKNQNKGCLTFVAFCWGAVVAILLLMLVANCAAN